jgi:hypothetical protein
MAAPFVAAAPAGARVRTRLRVTAEDAAVLRTVGRHRGSLASADLAARCAEGSLDAKGNGNPAGRPVTIPLQLAGLPATQRDGRLRAAISELIRIAREGGLVGGHVCGVRRVNLQVGRGEVGGRAETAELAAAASCAAADLAVADCAAASARPPDPSA